MENNDNNKINLRSNTMKKIMGTKQLETNCEIYRISITSDKIKDLYDAKEYDDFLYDLKALSDVTKHNPITDIVVTDTDLSQYPDVQKGLLGIFKQSNYIKIENSKLGNLEHLFQEIFEKKDILDANLRNENSLKKFIYDRDTKSLTVDSSQTANLLSYEKYADTKNLILEVKNEEDKSNIVKNIDLLRDGWLKTHRQGSIFLKDVSDNKDVQDLGKYESYANGNIVLFKSRIIKETMGFDKLPTNKDLGIRYNLKIDGDILAKNEQYKLEGQELQDFLSDLEEISKHVPLTGINIRNIDLSGSNDLSKMVQSFERIERLSVENSNIPNLESMINNMQDKNNLTNINIRNSGVSLEDISPKEFPNISTIFVENEEEKEKIELKQMEEQMTSPSENYLVDVKEPWYKRAWNRFKETSLYKMFNKDKLEALPDPDAARVNQEGKKNQFVEALRSGIEPQKNLTNNIKEQQTKGEIEPNER